MSLETIIIPVESRLGVTVPNHLLAHEPPSADLLILLPGRGYTCNHPVLYYLRHAGIERGYDVLSIEYAFQVASRDLDADSLTALAEDVLVATQAVLARGYQRVCIAGKSLGTPLAGELARTITSGAVSLLLLTPIGGALQGLGDCPTLAIIGTADPLYTPELVSAYDDHPTITWQVYDGLNHSLEMPGDWRASLAVLPEIITGCETFMSRGTAQ
ncbi:MAG TPA: alpha/beta family hydrolase [Phototrophicaceae bacterium]|nr:alpha/beta family hydrolase [Phototrophicaceae bacterium]